MAQVGDDFAKRWRDHFAQPEISGFNDLVVYQTYAHADEPLSALYGCDDCRHERLTRLKNVYDPKAFLLPITLSLVILHTGCN